MKVLFNLIILSFPVAATLLLANRKNLTSSNYHTVNFYTEYFEYGNSDLFQNLKVCADSHMQISIPYSNSVDSFKQCLETYFPTEIPESYIAPMRYTTSAMMTLYSVQLGAHSKIAKAMENRYNYYTSARHTFARMKYQMVLYSKQMTNKLSELDMWSPLSQSTDALYQIGTDFDQLKLTIDQYVSEYLVYFSDFDTKLHLEESIQTSTYNAILLLIPYYESNVSAVLKRLSTPKSALIPCSPGHYCAPTGTEIACPAGTFQPTHGMTGESACMQCNIGTYSLTGHATCTPCANGTLFGASSCAS